ncbi:MAG: hypothetical protein Kow002_13070 [Anaerolineales bacterium]
MRYSLPAVLFFIGVIVLAHFFAPPGYIWMDNTISELAAQGHVHKWIMQAGFVGFGLLLAGGLLWKFRVLRRIHYPDLPLLLYGICILVTGFYCTAPIDSSLNYSVREAQIHSLFATLAGFALVSGVLWYLIVSPENRGFHLAFLILITCISIVFGLAENELIPVGRGVVQRSLYLVSFFWLAVGWKPASQTCAAIRRSFSRF